MYDIIIFLIIVILVRGLYIWADRKSINHDSYFYLMLADDIRRKWKKKKSIQRFFDKPHISPPVFQYFLALIPKNILKKYLYSSQLYVN